MGQPTYPSSYRGIIAITLTSHVCVFARARKCARMRRQADRPVSDYRLIRGARQRKKSRIVRGMSSLRDKMMVDVYGTTGSANCHGLSALGTLERF